MTDHIKMPAILPRVQYVANGIAQIFTYPFPIFEASDIEVWLDAAVQQSGYSVQGAGQTNGGTISFDTPPSNAVVVTIERRLPLARMSDFVEGGEFSAQTLNQEFDTLVACVQQLNADSMPMLRYDNSEPVADVVIPKKSVRANKVLGFDSAGNPSAFEPSTTVAPPSFSAVGVGAINRTLTDKAREIVSAKDFGAIGDGIANDTNAIIAALAAADSVFLPAGTYVVSQTIELGNNKYVFGAGAATIIKANAQSFDTIALIGSYATLFNLCIDGGNNAVRLYGKTQPCRHNNIEKLLIKNAVNGLVLDGYNNTSNPCEWHNISHVHISNPSTHGVWLQKSGAGKAPMANKFKSVRVQSGAANMSGHGFYIASAKFHNAFIDCAAYVSASAQTCLRIGADTERNVVINLLTESAGAVPNIILDAGSKDTSFYHVQALSTGAVLQDNSGGEYNAININNTERNVLRRTRITDLTTEMQRMHVETITNTGPTAIYPDLTKSTYLMNANAGNVAVNLPKAAAGNNGAIVMFKKIDASLSTITIAELSGLGPDSRNIILSSTNDYATVMSDGASWRVLSSNLTPQSFQAFSGSTAFYPDAQKRLYTVNASLGSSTVRLPPAANAQNIGRILTIKKIDTSTNPVVISEEGALGPDNMGYTITTNNHAVTVMSDGVRWRILNKFVG